MSVDTIRNLLDELLEELADLDPHGVDPYAAEIAIVQYVSKTAKVDGIAGPETKASIAAWLDERIAERKKRVGE